MPNIRVYRFESSKVKYQPVWSAFFFVKLIVRNHDFESKNIRYVCIKSNGFPCCKLGYISISRYPTLY